MAGVPVAYMSRIESFSASHRLHNSSMSAESNNQIFGKCNNPNGHGHNYKLEVILRGPIDENTGMVMDLGRLKTIIQERVLDVLDHKHIDLDVQYFRESHAVSTTENVTVFIWNQLVSVLPRNLLYEVKLWETDKNVFSYRGEILS